MLVAMADSFHSVFQHPGDILKGTVQPQIKIHIFPLTVITIYSSRLFWCELMSFEDISSRNVRLFSNIMELDGTLVPRYLKN